MTDEHDPHDTNSKRDTGLDNEFLKLQRNFALLVRRGDTETKRTVYRLKAQEINIGRVGSIDFTLTGDIVLNDPGVSRLHCRLVRISKGRYAIADCGSSNGTYVNGTKIGDEGHMLDPDDIVDIGTAQFIYNPSTDWE